MITFLILFISIMVLGVVLFMAYLMKKSKKETEEFNSGVIQKNIQDNQVEFNIENTGTIKGAAFNICKQLDIWEGSFNGYLKITYSNHDEYAVGIYRNDNILVGWLPKKSVKVHNYLKQHKIKRLPCNGYFTYQQYRENTVHFKTHLPL